MIALYGGYTFGSIKEKLYVNILHGSRMGKGFKVQPSLFKNCQIHKSYIGFERK